MAQVQDYAGRLMLKTDDGSEARTVWCQFERNGGISVSELTEGELTREFFGGGARLQRLYIGKGALPAVAQSLGQAYGGWYRLAEQLTDFFRVDGCFLSELMDVFDGCGVTYSYLCDSPGAGVSYRPYAWDSCERKQNKKRSPKRGSENSWCGLRDSNPRQTDS